MDDLTFRRLSYNDKSLFDRYFLTFQPDISEMTFTNLYVWSDSRLVDYLIYQDTLIMYASWDGQKYFLPPIGQNVAASYELIFKLMKSLQIPIMKLIPTKHLNIINQFIKSGYSAKLEEDRSNFDYEYESDKMANLTSRKLSSKRNFIHRFQSQYKYDFLPYNSIYQQKCKALLDKWIFGRTDDLSLKNEYVAINNLLDQFDKLDAKGMVLLVENEVVAFAFGEKLNDESFVVHFEKADTSFVGVYQMINQLFVKQNILSNFKFVNREQDLGHQNIRQAKMSYYPDRFIEKYILSLE